jgi:hypothetical protein
MEALNFKNSIHCSYDIERAMTRIDRECSYKGPNGYRADHIFDEDQSVRWNKEEVIRRNQAIDEDKKKCLKIKQESHQNLLEEIYRYLIKEVYFYPENGVYHFTRNEALAIWTETVKHHDEEPWNWIDDMAESAYHFITANKERDK